MSERTTNQGLQSFLRLMESQPAPDPNCETCQGEGYYDNDGTCGACHCIPPLVFSADRPTRYATR